MNYYNNKSEIKIFEKSDITKRYDNHRRAYKEIENFLSDDDSNYGRVLVLYGLRRTGKTILMEQILDEYCEKEKCFYYIADKNDTVDTIESYLKKMREKGVTIACIDEVTRLSDFSKNASSLADIFAKKGMRIILTGTDSLGFAFAEKDELLDRMERISTTYIPFAEHCEVLGNKDLDDYIQFGGLMRKGAAQKRVIHDYDSMKKYLDSAVSGNISYSITHSNEDNCLEGLTEREIRTIIEKIVSKYSGAFDKKISNNPVDASVMKQLITDIENGDISNKLVDEIDARKQNILTEFAKEINADEEIVHKVNDKMLKELQNYLLEMQLLSVVDETEYKILTTSDWIDVDSTSRFYIIQPAIKYNQLNKSLEMLSDSDFFKNIPLENKEFVKDGLKNYIFGLMAEEIIFFDTKMRLDSDKYDVLKPKFSIDGNTKGEYDLLVHDKTQNNYWVFEVKHSDKAVEQQAEHLKNTKFTEIMNRQFGERKGACVLYNGESFFDGEIYHVNMVNFLQEMDKQGDVNKAMEILIDKMPKDIIIERHPSGDITFVKSESKPTFLESKYNGKR